MAPGVGSIQNYNIYRSDNGSVFKLIGISTTTSFDDLNSGTSSAATYPSLGDLSTWVTSSDNCGNIQTGQLNTARSGASAFVISNGGFSFGGTNVALIGGLSNGANFLSNMECKTLSYKYSHCGLTVFLKKKDTQITVQAATSTASELQTLGNGFNNQNELNTPTDWLSTATLTSSDIPYNYTNSYVGGSYLFAGD